MVAVGDKVEFIGRYGTDLRIGVTYPVVEVDKDSDIAYVCVIDDVSERNWIGRDDFKIADPTDELQELRAFRDRALAKFPSLAEPESDDEAAERITKAYMAKQTGCLADIAHRAIEWARANPR